MRALIEVAEALEGMADSHKVRRNELTTLAERLRALAFADDPELDGTDAAHPAWWRGNDAGASAIVREANEILDGDAEGKRGGVAREPWESLRRRLYDIRDNEPRAITATEVGLFGVRCWLPSSIAASVRSACELAEDGNLAAAHGHYFCDGPQGHFYTDDLANARALCALIDPDGDDWTVTDTRNPTGGR